MTEEGARANWQWQDERTLDMTRDLRNCKFLTLKKGDKVWPLWNSLPVPTRRQDQVPWQYGLNLTTAKYGWFPENLVEHPPDHLLHEEQKRTRERLAMIPTRTEQQAQLTRTLAISVSSEGNSDIEYESQSEEDDNQEEPPEPEEDIAQHPDLRVRQCVYCGCNLTMTRPHHFFCISRPNHNETLNDQLTVPATQSSNPVQESEAMSSDRTETEYLSSPESISGPVNVANANEWFPSNAQTGDASAGDTSRNSDSEGLSY